MCHPKKINGGFTMDFWINTNISSINTPSNSSLYRGNKNQSHLGATPKLDVDFAQESATFTKSNILSRSGSYSITQANATQQNVMKLLY